jgi:hypothetical protein
MRINELTMRGGGGGGTPADYPEVRSAALGSRAVVPGIEFPVASSRATGRLVVGSVVDENPGDGPLTLWWRGRLPSSFATSAGICSLGPESTHLLGGSGAVAFALAVIGGDVQLVMGNSTTRTQYALSMAGLAGQVADIVVTRSGLTLAAYVNGSAVTLTPVNTGAGFAADAAINGDFYHAGAPLSATISGANNVVAGPCQRFVLFNRALSAADASSLILNGVDVTDQWGTKAELINATTNNGGFETAGAGGADTLADWIEISFGTSTVNRDTAVFLEGTASARITSDASSSFAGIRQDIAAGRRYRIRFAFRHDRAATNVTPQVTLGANNIPAGLTAVAPNTWSVQTVEAVSSEGRLDFGRTFGVPSTNFWFDGVVITRIGAIVDLQFDGTAWGMVGDRANQRDAVMHSGAALTMPDSTRGFARWVGTVPGGERIGGGVAVAIIPTTASISRVVVRNINLGSGQTFSMGTSSGTLTNIINAAPLNGTGDVTVIDPALSVSSTGELWIAYTGTGAIEVEVV